MVNYPFRASASIALLLLLSGCTSSAPETTADGGTEGIDISTAYDERPYTKDRAGDPSGGHKEGRLAAGTPARNGIVTIEVIAGTGSVNTASTFTEQPYRTSQATDPPCKSAMDCSNVPPKDTYTSSSSPGTHRYPLGTDGEVTIRFSGPVAQARFNLGGRPPEVPSQCGTGAYVSNDQGVSTTPASSYPVRTDQSLDVHIAYVIACSSRWGH